MTITNKDLERIISDSIDMLRARDGGRARDVSFWWDNLVHLLKTRHTIDVSILAEPGEFSQNWDFSEEIGNLSTALLVDRYEGTYHLGDGDVFGFFQSVYNTLRDKDAILKNAEENKKRALLEYHLYKKSQASSTARLGFSGGGDDYQPLGDSPLPGSGPK